MIDRVLADAVVSVHMLYIVFVVLGGLLVVRWPWVVWIHLPAAAWGALVELFGFWCPLTPLENYFRARAGVGGYEGGFIETYLLPLIYPGQLTRGMQIGMGAGVMVLNLAIYAWICRRWPTSRRTAAAIAATALLLSCTDRSSERSESRSAEPAAELEDRCDAPEVREVVARLGQRLKDVPLLAPEAVITGAIRTAYGQTFEEFVAGFDETASVEVEIGTPGRVDAAAGSRYVEVPVTVRAVTRSGERQRFEGSYVLRRVVVEGAPVSDRRWHIYSATFTGVH